LQANIRHNEERYGWLRNTAFVASRREISAKRFPGSLISARFVALIYPIEILSV
jgi:hypothetical protein